MARVRLMKDETQDDLLRRFKRAVKKENIIQECRKREFFLNNAEKRRAKSKAARIRSKKRK